MIQDYNLNYVINTDQTGCKCHVNIRTASHKGAKTTEVLAQDTNKIKHANSVQYAIR
jgi:hypothetical protein